jgi:hypothetical protein
MPVADHEELGLLRGLIGQQGTAVRQVLFLKGFNKVDVLSIFLESGRAQE